MGRFQVICLWIVATLFVTVSVLPVSAEEVLENETDGTDPVSEYNETELLEQETFQGLRFLTTMLHMLDFNLNLISGTLNARVEEYPFLQPTIDGINSEIATVDSVLIVMGSDPEGIEGANETNLTEVSFNERVALLNESLSSPDSMTEAANSTLGEPEVTTGMINDIFGSVKAMLSLFE